MLIGAGVILGANWATVQNWVGSYSNVVLVVAAVGVAGLLVFRHYRRDTRDDGGEKGHKE